MGLGAFDERVGVGLGDERVGEGLGDWEWRGQQVWNLW